MLISKMSEYDYEIIVSAADDGYIYAKGDIPIMLVAHMDTVHTKDVKEIYVSDYGNITSPQGIGGDDRCGIYMITQLLHKKPYVLFTENEEIGCRGAKQFAKDYNDPNTSLPKAEVKYIIEEYLCHNWDLLNEAASEFGENAGDWIKKGAEFCDVSIRCYLLSQAISNILNELENNGFFA